MNSVIQQYYETLQDRDSRCERYYFEIYGISNNNGNEIKMPLVNISRNSRGADLFLEKAKFAAERNFDEIEYLEYAHSSNNQNNVPKLTQRISLKENKSIKKSKSRSKATQQPLSGVDVFNGLGGLEGAFARENENNRLKIDNQYLRKDLDRTEDELLRANDKLEKLIKENESLKKQIDKSKDKEEKLHEKLTLGSLASRAIFGVVCDKMGITENTLKGFLGGVQDEEPHQSAQTQQQNSNVEFEEDNEYISIVSDFMRSRPEEMQQKICAILQFVEEQENNIDLLFECIKKIKEQINNGNIIKFNNNQEN